MDSLSCLNEDVKSWKFATLIQNMLRARRVEVQQACIDELNRRFPNQPMKGENHGTTEESSNSTNN